MSILKLKMKGRYLPIYFQSFAFALATDAGKKNSRDSATKDKERSIGASSAADALVGKERSPAIPMSHSY